jgi:hypothetical protein
VQRIVTDRNGRIFKFSSNVLILDRYNKKDFSKCRVVFKNPLPVWDDGHRMIGAVNLELINTTIMGSFFIDYSTPERLNIENKDIHVYPLTEGFSTCFVEKDFENYIYYEIDGVMLSFAPPTDDRIGAI